MISEKFRVTVKAHPTMRCYEIAQAAGLHYSTLSRLLRRIDKPHKNDSRVIAVGRVVGLTPEECFEEDGQ